MDKEIKMPKQLRKAIIIALTLAEASAKNDKEMIMLPIIIAAEAAEYEIKEDLNCLKGTKKSIEMLHRILTDAITILNNNPTEQPTEEEEKHE